MMRRFLFVLCLVVGLPGTAVAAYTSLFVFGDSLSDGGNAYALSAGAWPLSPPNAQRFSDGPVAAEVLASQLDISGFSHSAAGGTNYAVGGATTGLGNFNFTVNAPTGLPPAIEFTGMQSQVAAFAASSTVFDPAKSLFMVWGGPNDVFLGLAQGVDATVFVPTAVSNIAGIVGALATMGARNFLVPNMPNLAVTPFGLSQDAGGQAGLAAITAGFNAGLALALGQVGALFPPVNIIEFDAADFFARVIANPGGFGFVDVTTPCYLVGNCDGYLFVDGVHPTAQAHALLGRAFARAVPEPATPALIALALLALLAPRARTVRQTAS